jgi:hypothetical protein
MRMKVSHEQFEIHGDRLRHAPTGALFWMGETDVAACDLGLTGTDTGAGPDYNTGELKQAAYEVFKLQKGTCI